MKRSWLISPLTEAEQKDLPQLLQETLNAIDKAKSASGKADQEVLFGGLEGQLAQLAQAASAAAEASEAEADPKPNKIKRHKLPRMN